MDTGMCVCVNSPGFSAWTGHPASTGSRPRRPQWQCSLFLLLLRGSFMRLARGLGGLTGFFIRGLAGRFFTSLATVSSGDSPPSGDMLATNVFLAALALAFLWAATLD